MLAVRAVHRVASRRVLDADVRACHQLILTRLDSFGRMNAMSFACCSVLSLYEYSRPTAAPRRAEFLPSATDPVQRPHPLSPGPGRSHFSIAQDAAPFRPTGRGFRRMPSIARLKSPR
jgi:hypothetical protein